MPGLFNNGMTKVLSDNATNIMGAVKQGVLNVSPCRTHRRELKDLVNFIIENSVVGDESEEGNADNIMINNLKKVTTICDDDINGIIKAYKETPRYDEFEQDNEGKFIKKLLSKQGEENLTFRMLFKNHHLLNANFIGVNLVLHRGYREDLNLLINKVVKSNGSKDYAIYYRDNDVTDDTKLQYPLQGNQNEASIMLPIYAYEFTKIILNKMPEGINYNETEAREADLRGGKRKTKAYSKKVAKKPVASQKKQSIYKEIFGKQMKIYKMPDSRKEYVKYKGDLHLITDYKSLIMKQKANAKPKPKK